MDCVAIIPARIGSKGIPRKNLRELSGRPLVAWTIDGARSSGVFDAVVVNSDSSEVLSVAADFQADVFHRPLSLGQDHVHSYEVVRDQCTRNDYPDDTIVCMLLPTSPLRSPKTIREAKELFLQNREYPVISVYSSGKKEQHLRVIDNDFLYPLSGSTAGNVQRDTGRELYFLNGSMYWWTAGWIRKSGSFHVPQARAFVMSERESVDVDTLEDLQKVESYLNKR